MQGRSLAEVAFLISALPALVLEMETYRNWKFLIPSSFFLFFCFFNTTCTWTRDEKILLHTIYTATSILDKKTHGGSIPVPATCTIPPFKADSELHLLPWQWRQPGCPMVPDPGSSDWWPLCWFPSGSSVRGQCWAVYRPPCTPASPVGRRYRDILACHL